MAIIPDAQQFHTLSSTVDTTERGSALANASREVSNLVDTIKVKDEIFYDKAQAHEVIIDDQPYVVIQERDVVVVL